MKIFLWDVETAPLIVYTWGIFDQNINIDNIIKDSSLICASWKFLGDRKVSSVSLLDDMEAFVKDPYDDKVVVHKLHEALSGADVIVGHNGDRFDLKVFNARALYHGLPPLPPIPSVDTLKVAKAYFRLTSNKLDYISKFLGFRGKSPITMEDWRKITQGDVDAVKRMVKYNKDDVTELERVYLRLRPWMKTHPNFNTIMNNTTAQHLCPSCGSSSIQKRGYSVTRTGRFQRYQCQVCFAWSKDGTNTIKGVLR